MDRKQVIIVALLVVSIILSTASVVLNVSVFNGSSIRQASFGPSQSDVGIRILPSQEIVDSGGSS